MTNVRILEKPLVLSPGSTAWLKKGLSRLIIQIISDMNGVITYKFPLKPSDKTEYQAAKSDVFVQLTDCENHTDLSLSRSPYVTLDKYSKQNSQN